MAPFPPSKFLNINNGPGAWRQFLVDLALQLISFAEAAIEFRHGTPTKLTKRPTHNDHLDDDDVTPPPTPNPFNNFRHSPPNPNISTHLNLSTASTIQQPTTPFTSTAAESKTADAQTDDEVVLNQGTTTPQTPYDLPGLLPAYQPQFKYRRLPDSNTLSDAGHSDLRQDQKDWDSGLKDLQHKRRSLIEYVLSICHPDSITALNNDIEFTTAITDLDVVKLHHIFARTHEQNNAVISLNTLYSFLQCTQGNRSLEEFAQDVKNKKISVTSEFEDAKHPGFISTELLVNCVLLKGVDKSMAPLIMQLLTASTSSLRSMTPASILAHYRQFQNNISVNNQNRQPTNPNPKPHPHSTPHTAALATPNSNNKSPQKENSYKYPEHPHSRPTVPLNSVNPKGDLSLPYCSYCAKAGYVSNHHGPHTKFACFDKTRFEKDRAEAHQPSSSTAVNTAWNQQAALARTQSQTNTQQANINAALATPSGQAALSTAYMQGAESAHQAIIDQAALTRLNTSTFQAYQGDGTDDHAAGGGNGR